jgi:hypothetical protein
VRVRYPRKGLCATRPGTLLRRQVPTRSSPPDTAKPDSVEADTVAHCGESTAGDYINSLTFTELFSGWTENRAVWNKSSHAILCQLKELEEKAPFKMENFHADNGSEFLNWALYEHLTGRKMKGPFTRSRAYRKNDNPFSSPSLHSTSIFRNSLASSADRPTFGNSHFLLRACGNGDAVRCCDIKRK